MSVHGEFRRLVSDTVACLQASEGESARALARRLEAERMNAKQDLLGAAARVIEIWEAEHPGVVLEDAELRARLEDASDRMQRIARVVLGR